MLFTQIDVLYTKHCVFLYLCIIEWTFISDCGLLSVELDQMFTNLANCSTVEQLWHLATQIVKNCSFEQQSPIVRRSNNIRKLTDIDISTDILKEYDQEMISFWNGNPCPRQWLHNSHRLECWPQNGDPWPLPYTLPHQAAPAHLASYT